MNSLLRNMLLLWIGTVTLAAGNPDSVWFHADSGYAFGLSSYFQGSETRIPMGALTDVAKIHNHLGFSFRAGAAVPVWKKLFIAPAFGVTYGYQKSEYLPAGDSSKAVRQNLYFRLWTAELNVGYEYLSLANGWDFYALLGLSSQALRGDEALAIVNRNFLGWQAGLGFRFQQISHLGFHMLVMLRDSLEKPRLTQVGLGLGLTYNLKRS